MDTRTDVPRDPSPAPRRRRWLARLLVLKLGVAALLLAAAWAMLASTTGTAWLLRQLPGVTAQGVQGSLLGERLRIERLSWDGQAGKLELDELSLLAWRWRWRPNLGQWLALTADGLTISSVSWSPAPGEGRAAPPRPPLTLALPMELSLPVRIGTLQLAQQPPVRDLALRLALGHDGGRHHALEDITLTWDRLQLKGRLALDGGAGRALDGLLQLQSHARAPWPWSAAVRVAGRLERVELVAGLEARARAGAAPTELTLRAALEPFARWPLAALDAQTENLDLAALGSGLPTTRLAGTVRIEGRALDQPMGAAIDLVNRLPGPWDQSRLPLRRAQLELKATPTALDTLELDRFELLLGDASAAAGRLSGTGRWTGQRLVVEADMKALKPQHLDHRAAPASFDGPVHLELEGLPDVDPAAASQTATALRLGLRTQLDARVEDLAPPLRLELALQAQAGQVTVQRLVAGGGGARAELSATARRSAARWALQTKGRLVDFDPLPWWPGKPGQGWQRGGHRLNADWELDLELPSKAMQGQWQDLPLRMTGEGRLRLQASRLAGVPLSANARITQAAVGPGGAQRGTRLEARLEIDGNRLDLDGQALPLVEGSQDRWRLALSAPRLAALAPLFNLAPDARTWAPRSGRIELQASAQGRWPEMHSEGSAQWHDLRLGDLSLEQATASWQLASDAHSPLRLALDAQRLELDGQRLPSLGLRLDGSWSRHAVRLDMAVPQQPPPALAKALDLTLARGTRLALRGEGGWGAQASGSGSRWQGRVARLAVGAWDGRASVAEDQIDAGWLDARELRAEVDLGPAGNVQALHAHAGRATLAAGVGLRWDDLRVDWRQPAPELSLKARIESFDVAPFLARWQPAMGWDGDLSVGASVELQAGTGMDADIVIERERGDLQVLDGADRLLPLGLSDLRLALGVHEGLWTMTAGLAGRTLGELGGIVQVQAGPGDRVPPASAALDGSMLMRVGDLGVWGTWVPPGWRLAGSVETSAVFGGRLGSPEISGELRGRGLAVRNVLQGVHVTDGQVDLRLEGDRAVIERFTLRGGDGELSLSGGAEFGAQPAATIQADARAFQVLGRIDRRLVASGRAELRLDARSLDLKGRFGIDRAWFDLSRGDAPSLDDDVVVQRPSATGTVAQPVRGGAAPRRRIGVDVNLDLGEQLEVRGRGLATRLTGELKLSAPGGRLAVHGVVRTVGGSYAAYGQRMVVERGIVSFNGPVESPQLDVLALRPKLDVEVGVAITGSAQTPRVRLHANPEMSETDKLSWLVLGRAPDALGRTDTALLQRAAIALLSGEEAGPTDALIRRIGLDEFSVRQAEDGDVRDTVVSLGKQLSERWYVGYERSVNATSGTWQLIYRAAQRFTLRAQSGLENALDVIWTWREQ